MRPRRSEMCPTSGAAVASNKTATSQTPLIASAPSPSTSRWSGARTPSAPKRSTGARRAKRSRAFAVPSTRRRGAIPAARSARVATTSRRPRPRARGRCSATHAERALDARHGCDPADHRPEHRAEDRDAHRASDQTSTRVRGRVRDQPREARRPGARARGALEEARGARAADSLCAKPKSAVVIVMPPSPMRIVGLTPRRVARMPAGIPADERAERVRARENARAGLRQPELLRVMRQQRRQRRVEHRVDEDDRADEEEQPLQADQPGLRLSRNARRPSWPSSPARRPAAIRASSLPSDGRSRASRLRCARRLRARLQDRVDQALDRCIELVRRPRARARSAARSSASKRSPVTKNRRAAPAPIFASTNGEMTAGMIPSRTSVKPNVASGAATTMSAHATSPEPPPSAKPCTRATSGAGQASTAAIIRYRRSASSTFSSKPRSIDARCHSTSAPAQKLGPSPARTTTRASPTSENASCSSAISAASKAFRRSGLRERDAQDAAVALDPEPGHRVASLRSGAWRRTYRSGADAAPRRRARAGRGRVRARTCEFLQRRRRRRRSSRSARPARGSCSRPRSGCARRSCSSTARST